MAVSPSLLPVLFSISLPLDLLILLSPRSTDPVSLQRRAGLPEIWNEHGIKGYSKNSYKPSEIEAGQSNPVGGKGFLRADKRVSHSPTATLLGVQQNPQAKQLQFLCRGPHADSCRLWLSLQSLWAPMMSPALLSRWVVSSWCPGPLWLLQSFLPSFMGFPELCLLFDCGSSPAFAPIGCWMKFLWRRLG